MIKKIDMRKKTLIIIILTIFLLTSFVGYIIFTQFENNISPETSDAVTKNIEYTTVGNLTPITLIVIFVLFVISIILYKNKKEVIENDKK